MYTHTYIQSFIDTHIQAYMHTCTSPLWRGSVRLPADSLASRTHTLVWRKFLLNRRPAMKCECMKVFPEQRLAGRTMGT